jgi:hypothetical protein
LLVTGINFSSAYSHIHRVIPGRLWRNKMDIMHAELLSIAENIVLHSQAAFNWVMDPKNRTIVKTILWIGAVSLLLTLTVTFILMPYFFTASYKFGIAATVLWEIYLVYSFYLFYHLNLLLRYLAVF